MTLTQVQSSPVEKRQTSRALQGFDYAILDAEPRIVVERCTDEIRSLICLSNQHIMDIGQNLIEVKERLGHGNFIEWLQSEFSWSESTVNRYMRVSKTFKSVKLTDLKIATSALYLLAAPSTPSEASVEAIKRAKAGEAITHTKAKEIVTWHKKAAPTPEAQPSVKPSKDPAGTEMPSRIKIGNLICLEQQEHKWFGKVAEIKEVTPTHTEVIVTIPHPLNGTKLRENSGNIVNGIHNQE